MFKSRARKFADMFSTSLKDVLEGGELDKTAVGGLTDVEAKADANAATVSALHSVATTGSYNDLTDKPVLQAFPSGTKMLFKQTAAPTGWTKDTTDDDATLRVVSGTAGSGGTQNFTTAFSSRSTNSVATSGTVGNKTLTSTHMPSHRHYTVYNSSRQYSSQYGTTLSTSRSTAQRAHGIGYESYTLNAHSSNANVSRTNASGSSGAHNHSFTGSSHSHTLDMSVKYVDIIIATKD